MLRKKIDALKFVMRGKRIWMNLEEIDKFIVVDLGNTSFLLVSTREMIVK